jgi:hypothetical protein
LYICIPGDPGDYKTQTIELVSIPITKRNRVFGKAYKEQKEQRELIIAEQKKDKKNTDPEPPMPIRKYIRISGHTLEALRKALSENPRGIAIVIDELIGLFLNMNKFNKGDDSTAYLEMFSGVAPEQLLKSQDYVDIPFVCLNIFGGTQFKKVRQFFEDGRSDNGMIDRILFAFPEQTPKMMLTDGEVPQDVLDEYCRVIDRLLDLDFDQDIYGQPLPYELTLSAEANALYKEWYARNAEQKIDEPETVIKGMLTKMTQYTLRFALILQLLDYACNGGSRSIVSAQSMASAIRLTEYHKNAFMSIYDLVFVKSAAEKLTGDRKRVYDALPNEFTVGDAIQLIMALTKRSDAAARKEWTRFSKDANLFKKQAGKYTKIS